jgi:alkanesulfonate monooxygenase SsuD/methylene tetrahydromethanopterin reductase-like flavin-dependent oxidoreductase (luciferase family)
MGEDGKPVKPGLIPSLEESMKQRTILVGTAEEVAEQVQEFRDLLGVQNLTLFPHLVGDPYSKAVEQMGRFMTDVVPLVR